ncbi:hypothetical protein ABZ593_21290 [Streptomyces sp. NPDC012617]|uniref:hypothetical protein n=1 Tax=Streptomyces TaxID=1883 RepID=UPI0033CD89C9
MSPRAYCRCTAVQNFDYDAAAEKLGCTRAWLEANIGRLPRQKFGAAPAVFCECELGLIQAMNTVLPDDVRAFLNAADGQEESAAGESDRVLTLAAIRPSGSRKTS